MSSASSVVESLIVETLRGEMVDAARLAEYARLLVEFSRRHGVTSLIADRLSGRPDVPAALQAALKSEAQREAVADLVREPELRRMLQALADAGIGALVFKGAQLAYTLYPRPDLRPRLDTDILIPLDARARVHEVLTTSGYVASEKVSGELAISQKAYAKTLDGVEVHAVDVHWQIACPQVFAQALEYGELRAGAVPIPALGPQARGPHSLHAMLIACIHLVAHHRGTEELKWFYDLHLLAGRLGDPEWAALSELAREREVSEVMTDALTRTRDLFGTAIRLAPSSGGARVGEPSARFLRPMTRSEVLLDDLGRLGGWRARLRLLREHLFPSRRYMRGMYAPGSRLPLPALYLVRILTAAPRWLRSGR